MFGFRSIVRDRREIGWVRKMKIETTNVCDLWINATHTTCGIVYFNENFDATFKLSFVCKKIVRWPKKRIGDLSFHKSEKISAGNSLRKFS